MFVRYWCISFSAKVVENDWIEGCNLNAFDLFLVNQNKNKNKNEILSEENCYCDMKKIEKGVVDRMNHATSLERLSRMFGREGRVSTL